MIVREADGRALPGQGGLKASYGAQKIRQISLAEEVEVDEQRIEVADRPLPAVIRGKWVVVIVGLVKGGVEAAEEGGHGEIDASVPVIDRGVDEDGPAGGVTEEVAGPKIAVEEGWRFGREEAG